MLYVLFVIVAVSAGYYKLGVLLCSLRVFVVLFVLMVVAKVLL